MVSNKKLSTTYIINNLNDFFNEYEDIIHILFQIFIIVVVINIIEQNRGLDKKVINTTIYFSVFIIVLDYSIWQNIYQSLLLALLLFGYLFYSRQQNSFVNEFNNMINITFKKNEFFNNINSEEIINEESINEESHNEDDRNKNERSEANIEKEEEIDGVKINNPNVLDFQPDDINNNIITQPYNKDENKLNNNTIDKTLGILPKFDYSGTTIGDINETIMSALDDMHSIPFLNQKNEIMEVNQFRKGKKINNNKNNDKWNLDRYYPKCKTINDEPLYQDKKGLNNKNPKISNKILQYCTNLPEISENEYDLISGNDVELINKKIPHIQMFPRQFDIGGNGIVTTDFRKL